MLSSNSFSGNIIDVINKRIYSGNIVVEGGIIKSVTETGPQDVGMYIMPGFIDAHVHVESSMLIPSEFSRLASIHGTVATVSDPHEIANVCGMDGIGYMIENARSVPFKFFFGAPSCVPATPFETSGAVITPNDVEQLLNRNDIKYLSEMMNYPGVLNGDSDVMAKLKSAHSLGKPVDGHAPGLIGTDAANYALAGISTDHECTSMSEALDKIKAGMKILIREGSAAQNLNDLAPLIDMYPDYVMLCSDDKHPDQLLEGHINEMVRRLVNEGYDLFNVLKAACVNPVLHYGLNVGLLRPGDPADFVTVMDTQSFSIVQTVVDGHLIAEMGKTFIPYRKFNTINNFHARKKTAGDFKVRGHSGIIKVIGVSDGSIVTDKLLCGVNSAGGYLLPSPQDDILKIAVINRYEDTKPAVAFIKGLGIQHGAIASSIAHDSHNIVASGVDDESIAAAVNLIVENSGGIAIVSEQVSEVLPLPVAGLMSDGDAFDVALKYAEMDEMAKNCGSNLNAPFMTLSFMALTVIPALKLSDKGLFDGQTFTYTDLYATI